MLSDALLAGLYVACLAAGTCGAQEAAPPSIQLDRVLGAGPVDPQLLWRRLLDSDYRFGAKGHPLGAYFETLVNVKDSDGAKAVFYWQLDGNADRCVRYTPDSEPNSPMLFIDNNLFFIEASRQWMHKVVKPWSHSLDSRHFMDFISPEGVSETSINVDLGGYLSQGSPTISKYSWDAATLTLMVVKGTGSRWQIKFRTPVDQRRFGSILSELDLRGGADSGVINHRCFIVDRDSPLRIGIGTVQDVAARLNARNPDQSGPALKFLEISGPEDLKPARQLSLLVNHLPASDPRPTRFPDSRSRYGEMVPGYLEMYGRDVSPAIRGAKAYPFVREFVVGFVEELEIAQHCIETAVAPDGGPIDDPCLKWLALERGIEPRRAGLLIGDACAGILNWNDAPLESRVALAIAISEFGPPTIASSATFLRDDVGPLLHAIVHARWGWLPTDAELAECVRVMNEKDAGAVLKLAAIDSLVRWGRFELIPRETLAEWSSSRLSGNVATRSSAIRCLARSTNGRALLRDSCLKGGLPRPVASQVAVVLRAHATATLELQRFDFMPEEECRAIVALCDRIENGSPNRK